MRIRVLSGLLALTFALAVFSRTAAAQDASTDPRAPGPDPAVSHASPTAYDQGFVLRSADGINSLRVVGLFQLQYSHAWLRGAPESDSIFVNRARVGLLGSVFSRNLRYTFVAEFGGGDVRLLFLNVDYTLVRDWLTVRIGRFKRPFSRSFMTTAGRLSMIDRPLTVEGRVFGDGMDVGVILHNGSSGPFEYAVGVFSGNAASGAGPDRVDPLVALRVGYNTGGLNGYDESDLDGGAPRFGIAAAGFVDLDADGDHDSLSSGLVDVMFKAYGFTLSSASHVGIRQRGPVWSDQRFGAVGHYTQIGHVIAGRLEPVVRYAFLMPAGGGKDQHDLAGGLNAYFHGQAFKLQNFVSVRYLDERAAPAVHFQSQLTLAW